MRSLSCIILVRKGQEAKSEEEVICGPGVLERETSQRGAKSPAHRVRRRAREGARQVSDTPGIFHCFSGCVVVETPPSFYPKNEASVEPERNN